MKSRIKKILHFILGFICFCTISILLKIKQENIVLKMKYNILLEIKYFSRKRFIRLKKIIVDKNVMRIKGNRRINIAFITYTGSMWSVDRLYQRLKESDRFNVDIVIAKLQMDSSTAREETFEETRAYFENIKKYDVVPFQGKKSDLEKYDILFYLTPYYFYDNAINVKSITLNHLLCYVSYSYMLADNLGKLDLPLYLLAWKNFCDSLFYKQLIEEKSQVYTGNAEYCGYPKMDEFYCINRNKKSGTKKIIIYAPHHSVSYEGIKSATFDMNFQYIYDLAKKYRDTTEWIYKPHPVLRDNSVKAGIFGSVEEYDLYQEKWSSLDNATVITNGDYIQTFVNSDAMITDSISFLAEYQFTGNPLLLLESGKQVYNEFGNALKKNLYKCNGNEYSDIEKFVTNVVEEIDDMLFQRQDFFKENLDYYDRNGKLACDYVYDILSDLLKE